MKAGALSARAPQNASSLGSCDTSSLFRTILQRRQKQRSKPILDGPSEDAATSPRAPAPLIVLAAPTKQPPHQAFPVTGYGSGAIAGYGSAGTSGYGSGATRGYQPRSADGGVTGYGLDKNGSAGNSGASSGGDADTH
jgi:hypothetical protein